MKANEQTQSGTERAGASSVKRMVRRRWRLWPKVTIINYHKDFPQTMHGGIWERWFYFERMWGGRIWYFGVLHLALELDFRRDWLYDMAHPGV